MRGGYEFIELVSIMDDAVKSTQELKNCLSSAHMREQARADYG